MSRDEDHAGWSPQGPVTELSESASWGLLSTHSVGRLGISVEGRPDIFPVDYQLVEHSILFRSAAGSTLRGLDHAVVFEVDAEDDQTRWSVVVHGVARILADDPALPGSVESGFRDWIPTETFVLVEIVADSIRGRLFERRLTPHHHDNANTFPLQPH